MREPRASLNDYLLPSEESLPDSPTSPRMGEDVRSPIRVVPPSIDEDTVLLCSPHSGYR